MTPPRATPSLAFHAVAEDQPGPAWLETWRALGPAYERWYARPRAAWSPPSAGECRRALEAFMPELAPTYDRLLRLTNADDLTAGLLSLWRPPAFAVACSMGVWDGAEGPALVRNYEFSPDLAEGLLLRSAWGERAVMAMTDCLWGALDGINDAGLGVALAFGGRQGVGRGFGVPIIVRYVLETCVDLPGALAALTRIPSHMAYNVLVLDRAGRRAVCEIGPDRPPLVVSTSCAANHQSAGVDAPFAAATASRTRLEHAKRAVAQAASIDDLVARFHAPPLYSRRWRAGWGTLYTAVYRPAGPDLELSWPDHRAWRHGLDAFRAGRRQVRYTPRTSAAVPN